MTNLRAAVLAALFLVFAPLAALANDVTLTSRDGTLEISGTLLGFDGEFYRVDSQFGILTVDGSGVNCDGPACPTLGSYVAKFTLSGAQSMGEVLIPAIIEGYALSAGFALTREEVPGTGPLYRLFERNGETEAARITVKLTSSAEGFADLVGEEADVVLSLREVTAAERIMVRDAGLGDLRNTRQFRVIARDGLVPVVAPENPVQSLTMQQLADVFSGSITRWSELGGEDAPITLHMTEPQLGLGHVFVSDVLQSRGVTLDANALVHTTMRGLAEAVAQDPFGIGITSYSQSGFSDVLTLIGDCGFKTAVSPAAIKAGDYPLTAPMFLYLPARRLPKLARDFLAYMRAESAQFVIRRAGYVDQSFSEDSLASQGTRLANAITAAGEDVSLQELQRMVALFDARKRISLTFRFQGGSTTLDAPSRANVALLAAALEEGRFDGRKLAFVGFSDSDGDGEVNRRLSNRRAQAVLAAVMGETETFDPARVSITTDGFGEALPIACDESDWGSAINRRVEVWVE